MSRSLYLLVTSERPDPYLNSVVHCLLYEGVSHVNFLHIKGFGEPPTDDSRIQGNNKSAAVLRYVTSLLQDLATTGEYRFFAGEEAGRKVDLRQGYTPDRYIAMKEVYSQCLQLKVQWEHRDIAHGDLRKEVALIAAKKPSAIVDVSSVSKTFIGDLVAAGLIEGLESLYTFDLNKRPDYDAPWTMLFHDLKANSSSGAKYRYINILETPVFKECSRSLLVKRPSLFASLAAGAILITATLIAYFVRGPSSLFVQVTLLLSAITSLLSWFHSFFPLRR